MRIGEKGKENRGLNLSLRGRKRKEGIDMQRQKRGREYQQKRKERKGGNKGSWRDRVKSEIRQIKIERRHKDLLDEDVREQEVIE